MRMSSDLWRSSVVKISSISKVALVRKWVQHALRYSGIELTGSGYGQRTGNSTKLFFSDERRVSVVTNVELSGLQETADILITIVRALGVNLLIVLAEY